MESEVTRLYNLRFKEELKTRNQIWQVLCHDFFQKYVKKTDTVCDIGSGFGEFINNINAKTKYAVDINPQIKKYVNSKVHAVVTPSTKLPKKLRNSTNVAFASNFFEHLSSKDELVKTILAIKKILKRNGTFIILMPNIRFVGPSYWDFLDHQLPLTDRSMIEALKLNGFTITETRTKFLPYSTKSALPKTSLLVRMYLKMPLLHQIFGKQSLIIAHKH